MVQFPRRMVVWLLAFVKMFSRDVNAAHARPLEGYSRVSFGETSTFLESFGWNLSPKVDNIFTIDFWLRIEGLCVLSLLRLP